MNWYQLAYNIRQLCGNPDISMRSQLAVLENKHHVLLMSDYTNDEFIRITAKGYRDIFYFRPFGNSKGNPKDLTEKLKQTGFSEVLNGIE